MNDDKTEAKIMIGYEASRRIARICLQAILRSSKEEQGQKSIEVKNKRA